MSPLGIAFPGQSGLPVRKLMQLAKLAEDRGFACVLMREAESDSIAHVEALALATKRIGLGTGIANIHLRHPLMLGIAAAAVDELSEGRLLLGLGIGDPSFNERTLGLSMARPLERLREYVTILRGVVRGQAFTYQGEFYTVRSYKLGFRPARITVPVYLVALGPKMIRLAGELGEGMLLNLATAEHTSEAIALMRAAAESAGRDPLRLEVGALLTCCLSNDVAAARRAAKAAIAACAVVPYFGSLLAMSGFAREAAALRDAQAGQGQQGRVVRPASLVTDEMVDSLALVGTAADCRRGLEVYRRAGVTLPVVYPVPVDQDWEATLEAAITALSD